MLSLGPVRRAPRAERGVRGVQEPLGQEHAIAGQEALELRVENVADAVVAGVAARAPVRLHERPGGLERVPAWIALPPRRGPRIAEVGERHLRHDLEAQEVVWQVYAVTQGRRDEDGRDRRGAVGVEGTRLRLRRLHPDETARVGRRARRHAADQAGAGGVRGRVDEPLLVAMVVEDRGDLRDEGGLERGEARARERAHRTVHDGALLDREGGGAREGAHTARVEAEALRQNALRAEVRRGGQVRQRPAEPRAHLGRREAGGVDAGELRLEVVRLVDDQETAPPESLGVPVAERGEIGGVGAEDRRPEGGRLGADVRALAEWAARPAAGAARGRDVRAGIAVARVVVAALHDLELGAELALVLILEQLRSEEHTSELQSLTNLVCRLLLE